MGIHDDNLLGPKPITAANQEAGQDRRPSAGSASSKWERVFGLLTLGTKHLRDSEHPNVGDAALLENLALSCLREAVGKIHPRPLPPQWREWLIVEVQQHGEVWVASYPPLGIAVIGVTEAAAIRGTHDAIATHFP